MSSDITYNPDTSQLSTALFDDDDEDDTTFQPPTIIRSSRNNGHGTMNTQGLFDDKKRGLTPGGRRRKKSRKKKRRKRSTGRSGKKKTRRKTATVHKFEIIKRNPLTIKIFEKKGKKWVLIDTTVSQKGGVITRSSLKKHQTRFKRAQIAFFKLKKGEGMEISKIQRAWMVVVKNNTWQNYIPSNPQSAGKRKRTRKRRGEILLKTH